MHSLYMNMLSLLKIDVVASEGPVHNPNLAFTPGRSSTDLMFGKILKN